MKHFKGTAFKIIISILLLLTSIIIYSYFKPNNIFSNIISITSYPFQKMFWNLSDKVSNFSYKFQEKHDMQNEINNLKNEINQLRDKVIDYNNLKRENDRLIKYYDLKEENDSLKFVSASVIGINSSDVFKSFTIDKGSNSGISKNDIVITENGVVGCIYKVNNLCSKVRTIFSLDIKIGVADTENNESGIISGQPELSVQNLTRMTFIPSQNNMKQGDIIVTNGLSGMYPKNLKLGKIQSIKYDDKESTYYAIIEPFENFKNIKDVFVITDFYGKGLISKDT